MAAVPTGSPASPRVVPGTAQGWSLRCLQTLQQSRVQSYRRRNSPEDAPAVLQHGPPFAKVPVLQKTERVV